MRSLKLVLIAHTLILAVLLISCSDDSNPVADNSAEPRIEGNSYYNPELNFQISAPEGWSIEKDVEADGYTMLLWGEYNNLSSFNIIAQFTGGKTDMSGFLPAAKETISGMFDDVEFYSEVVTNTGGLESCELIYQINQNGALLIQRQIYFSNNQSIIVVTFSSLSSHYVQVSDDFDIIQNSLKSIR